uniref:Uncharacterized protein n=1 Tax=Setaria viridis TaxID=4556 RepID=A0A4U6UWY4_SETVI|nr:hypothetical protein SEVIR_4G178900v2 [Setaria viridis]
MQQASRQAGTIRPHPPRMTHTRARRRAATGRRCQAKRQLSSGQHQPPCHTVEAGTKAKAKDARRERRLGQQPQHPLGSAAARRPAGRLSPLVLPTARAVTPRAGRQATRAATGTGARHDWRGFGRGVATRGAEARRETRTLRQHVDAHVLRTRAPPRAPTSATRSPRARGQQRGIQPHAPLPSLSSCPFPSVRAGRSSPAIPVNRTVKKRQTGSSRSCSSERTHAVLGAVAAGCTGCD